MMPEQRSGEDRRAMPRGPDRRTITDLATHADLFVTVDELAGYWRVSRDVIYRDIEKGALRAIRVGRCIRIRVIDARLYGQPADSSSLTSR